MGKTLRYADPNSSEKEKEKNFPKGQGFSNDEEAP